MIIFSTCINLILLFDSKEIKINIYYNEIYEKIISIEKINNKQSEKKHKNILYINFIKNKTC